MFQFSSNTSFCRHATRLQLYIVIKNRRRQVVANVQCLVQFCQQVLRLSVHLSLPYKHAVSFTRRPTSYSFRQLLIGAAATASPPGRLRQRPRHQAVAPEARLPQRLHRHAPEPCSLQQAVQSAF
jgi:hypothetical protein